MISTKTKEAKVEYIKYKPETLPDAENIQNDFQYGKSIEKLDANIALRNAGSGGSTGPNFASGQLSTSSTGDTVINCGFKPKMIRYTTVAQASGGSDRYSGTMFNGVDIISGNDITSKATGLGIMNNTTDFGNSFRTNSISRSIYAWTNTGSNTYSYGQTSSVSDTGFTITIDQANHSLEIIWEAIG